MKREERMLQLAESVLVVWRAESKSHSRRHRGRRASSTSVFKVGVMLSFTLSTQLPIGTQTASAIAGRSKRKLRGQR
jgi:hypothetical protein